MQLPHRILSTALLCLGFAAAWSAEPQSGLSCEQLFSITKSTIQYRDEGYTLSQVLGALKSVQSEGKLTAAEIETLRKAVTLVYLGNAWPEEVAIECRAARGAK